MSFIFKGLNLNKIISAFGFSDSFSLFPYLIFVLIGVEIFYLVSGVITFFAYKEFNAWAVPFNDNADNEAEMGNLLSETLLYSL